MSGTSGPQGPERTISPRTIVPDEEVDGEPEVLRRNPEDHRDPPNRDESNRDNRGGQGFGFGRWNEEERDPLSYPYNPDFHVMSPLILNGPIFNGSNLEDFIAVVTTALFASGGVAGSTIRQRPRGQADITEDINTGQRVLSLIASRFAPAIQTK